MIEEGLEVPKLPTFNVESDSDSSITSTDRTYFVHVFNISWGGGNILRTPPPPSDWFAIFYTEGVKKEKKKSFKSEGVGGGVKNITRPQYFFFPATEAWFFSLKLKYNFFLHKTSSNTFNVMKANFMFWRNKSIFGGSKKGLFGY